MKRYALVFLAFACIMTQAAGGAEARTVTDALGRQVEIPAEVSRVICSGSGCLRLLTYLQAQNMAVAVDDIETRRNQFDARPYALANPRFKTLPTFGEFRGHDNPERILALETPPQVVLKTFTTGMGYDPEELQQKTGVPVVALDYGNLGKKRPQLYQTLRTMAEVVGRKDRAEAVIAFIEAQIADLEARTGDIPESQRPSAFKGPHGFQSTEPGYPPFAFAHVRNLAAQGLAGDKMQHADMAKEKIVEWNPDYLFLDLSTLQMGESAGGLHELKADPAYQTLAAVQQDKVYGVLPYNWYSQNFGSILADAWFIGGLLYPDRFQGLDPAAKADEIYAFLVGEPVFKQMNELFQGLAFTRVPLR